MDNQEDKECTGCAEYGCKACCPHDEFDHDICIECGHERDPGAAIDAAMDYLEDR
jgi:hypothetical protein